MQQEVQTVEGVSLVAIAKLLLSKIKYLILAVIIGGILGGSLAVWKTIDVNHYGTKVEFYVNPEKEREATDENDYGVYGAYGKPVMDSIVKLLNSESFAEQMILNGEALPEKDVWVNADNAAEVDLKLNEKIDAAQEKLTLAKEERNTLNGYIKAHTDRAKAYDEANVALDKEWSRLLLENKVKNKTFNEVEYEVLVDNGQAEEKLIGLVGTMRGAKEALQLAEEKVDAQSDVLKEKLAVAEKERNVALEAWRLTAKYKTMLAKYSNAVSFSYVEEQELLLEQDVARSFIYVNIFVLNDREFAEEVLNRVKTIVPAYVEARITIPEGYSGTNCERITRTDDIRLTNAGYTTSQAIKYGILAGFFALVVACAVVILVDKADKRLRDTSIITKQFNVPILGFIPSIDELDNEGFQENTNEKEAQ